MCLIPGFCSGRNAYNGGVIAYLSGVVREVRETSAVVVAGGVGYEVQCPTSTLAKLAVGHNAEFSTRFVVREDAQLLFGFSDADSLKLFDLLTSVSGVGPKLGLSLLSAMPVSALAQGLLSGFILAAGDPAGKPRIDLAGANAFLLRRAGVQDVWVSGRCSTEADFYSYRRDAGQTGRMWAVIGLPGGEA